MTKKQINLPIAIAVMVLIGAASFFGGMQYQKTQRGNFMFNGANGQGGNRMMMGQRAGGTQGQGGQAGNRMAQGFRPTNGEIISADNNSITVKLADGSSKIIMVGDSTKINEAKEASKSALTVGQKVVVFGTEKDGVVTAETIQLNPITMMMRPQ